MSECATWFIQMAQIFFQYSIIMHQVHTGYQSNPAWHHRIGCYLDTLSAFDVENPAWTNLPEAEWLTRWSTISRQDWTNRGWPPSVWELNTFSAMPYLHFNWDLSKCTFRHQASHNTPYCWYLHVMGCSNSLGSRKRNIMSSCQHI